MSDIEGHSDLEARDSRQPHRSDTSVFSVTYLDTLLEVQGATYLILCCHVPSRHYRCDMRGISAGEETALFIAFQSMTCANVEDIAWHLEHPRIRLISGAVQVEAAHPDQQNARGCADGR